MRDPATIADEAARSQCEQMRSQFDASLAAGNIFRGGSNTTHYGSTANWRIHFDPQFLDAAQQLNTQALREIANTALHEAAHLLGYSHPAGSKWVHGHDYYSDPPFNLLSPGPNSCLNF